MNIKRIVGIIAVTAAATFGLGGCGASPSYEGGCLISPTENQRQNVQTYLDRNRADVARFIAKGRELSPCYANNDPREYDPKKKRWDEARTDLNFPTAWKSDVDAAIAGYAVLGMPGDRGDLTRVAKIVTLEVWGGRSYFPNQVADQQHEVQSQQVELEGKPPLRQNFRGGVVIS